MRFPTNEALDNLTRALAMCDIDSARVSRHVEVTRQTETNNLVGRSTELITDSGVRDHQLHFAPYAIERPEIRNGEETINYRFAQEGDHLTIYRKDSGRPMGSADIVLTVGGLPVVVEVKADRKLERYRNPFRAGVLKAMAEYFGQTPAYVLVRTNDDYDSMNDRKKAVYLSEIGAKIVHLPFSRQEFKSYLEGMLAQR